MHNKVKFVRIPSQPVIQELYYPEKQNRAKFIREEFSGHDFETKDNLEIVDQFAN